MASARCSDRGLPVTFACSRSARSRLLGMVVARMTGGSSLCLGRPGPRFFATADSIQCCRRGARMAGPAWMALQSLQPPATTMESVEDGTGVTLGCSPGSRADAPETPDALELTAPNPWLTMWFAPRRTVRSLMASEQRPSWIPVVVLAGIASSILALRGGQTTHSVEPPRPSIRHLSGRGGAD